MKKGYATGGSFIFPGVNITHFSSEVLNLMKRIKPAGIVIYSDGEESPQEVKKIIEEIKKVTDSHLIVAVDQEGGKVHRLKKGFTPIPSAEDIGEFFKNTGDVRLIYELGKIMALELRAVGVNMNLAPVLDIGYEGSYIRKRAYSDKVNIVEEISLSLIAGMQDNHLAACGKHFPGHGPTPVDSHISLPKISRSERELFAMDLRPFLHAIHNGIYSIMVGHVVYSSIDDSKPASLSYKIVTGYLKEKLSFDGFVLSDDIVMGAITKHFKPEEAAVLALKAGVDGVIVSRDIKVQEKCWEEINRAIENGTLKPERLLESLVRLRSLKVKIKPRSQDDDISLVGCDAHRRLVERLLERARQRA